MKNDITMVNRIKVILLENSNKMTGNQTYKLYNSVIDEALNYGFKDDIQTTLYIEEVRNCLIPHLLEKEKSLEGRGTWETLEIKKKLFNEIYVNMIPIILADNSQILIKNLRKELEVCYSIKDIKPNLSISKLEKALNVIKTYKELV